VPPIADADRAALLSHARTAVAAHLAGDSPPPPPAPAQCPAGERPAAAFVTVRGPGRVLRGCIGRLTADRPLADVVAAMAVAAATQDPRFAPVAPSELAELRFEISVLSPPQAATPEQVVAGRDGVIVKRSGRQGVLLPAVAAEYGWDAPTLLTAACRKAGLPPGAWQDREAGKTELQVFQAEVFGEEE
jgi:uncharacterized protein